MSAIKFFFRKIRVVEPEYRGGEFNGLATCIRTPIQLFFDDWRFYGIREAVYNFLWLWRNR